MATETRKWKRDSERRGRVQDSVGWKNRLSEGRKRESEWRIADGIFVCVRQPMVNSPKDSGDVCEWACACVCVRVWVHTHGYVYVFMYWRVCAQWGRLYCVWVFFLASNGWKCWNEGEYLWIIASQVPCTNTRLVMLIPWGLAAETNRWTWFTYLFPQPANSAPQITVLIKHWWLRRWTVRFFFFCIMEVMNHAKCIGVKQGLKQRQEGNNTQNKDVDAVWTLQCYLRWLKYIQMTTAKDTEFVDQEKALFYILFQIQ